MSIARAMHKEKKKNIYIYTHTHTHTHTQIQKQNIIQHSEKGKKGVITIFYNMDGHGR